MTHQHTLLQTLPRATRRAAARLAGIALLVAGLGHAPLASADPPKTIGQKWRTASTCSWDYPGANTYMGMVAPSIERYTDIPPSVRDKLRRRLDKQKYDDLVVISRTGIMGRHMYEPVLANMQFGSRLVCNQTTRTRWKDDHIERGLVYCEGSTCILVPTTGRNISRVKRKPQMVATAPASAYERPAQEPQEPDLLDNLPPPAAGPAGGGGGGGGGGGFASPITPSFAQVATPTFSPVPALSSYSGSGTSTFSTGSGAGDGTGTGGSTGGGGGGVIDNGGGGSTNGGSTGGSTGPTTPVPEPQTYVLMLLGLAVVGSAAKRRATAP